MQANTIRLLTTVFGLAMAGWAQVKTEVPPVVPGAKPVTMERIKVHALRWRAIWKAMLLTAKCWCFCRPLRREPRTAAIRLSMLCTAIPSGPSSGPTKSTCPQTIEGAFAQGAQDMIIVLPDSKTFHNGSMYSSSVTTGDFERFIAHDLVAYIDAHYRTIPERKSRGLAGHSMGGYGAAASE